MFCSSCGSKVEDNEMNFCQECGESLSSPIKPPKNEQENAIKSKNGNSPFKKILTIAVFIFMCWVGYEVVSSAYNGTNPFQKKREKAKVIDEAAVREIYQARRRYSDCYGEGKQSYKVISDCLESSNLPVSKYDNTSCDNQLNTVIQAFIDAKVYCKRAASYVVDGNIPREYYGTYVNEVSKCSLALDQMYSLPSSWECGDVKIGN